MYPNPTKGVLRFSSNDNIDQVKVFSMEGKEVYSTTNSSEINMQQYPVGLYIVELNIGERVIRKRVAKE